MPEQTRQYNCGRYVLLQALQAAAQPGVSTAAESTLAMTNAALYMSKVAPPPRHAQRAREQAQQRQGSAAQQRVAQQKRKGAVIGAAPQLDPQVNTG